jgi:topoisomerase IA-like protein
METVHIRLEHDEALFAKKELLSSQIDTLELLKKFKQYKALRQKELIVQGRFRKFLNELKKQVSEMQEAFPEEKAHEEEMKMLEEIQKKKNPQPLPPPKPLKKKKEKIVKKTAKEKKAEKPKTEKARKAAKRKTEYDLIESQLSDIKSQLANLG